MQETVYDELFCKNRYFVNMEEKLFSNTEVNPQLIITGFTVRII